MYTSSDYIFVARRRDLKAAGGIQDSEHTEYLSPRRGREYLVRTGCNHSSRLSNFVTKTSPVTINFNLMNYLFWASKKKKKERAKKIFKELESKIAVSQQILNVGCGEGFLEKIILDTYPDVRITGIDKEISKEYAGIGIVGDFETIDLPAGSFDIIIFSLSLHHMTDPKRTLEKVKTLLKDNGLLFILEIAPKTNILKTLLFKTRILCLDRVHTWTESELLSLITGTGLIIAKIERVPVQGIIIHAGK